MPCRLFVETWALCGSKGLPITRTPHTYPTIKARDVECAATHDDFVHVAIDESNVLAGAELHEEQAELPAQPSFEQQLRGFIHLRTALQRNLQLIYAP